MPQLLRIKIPEPEAELVSTVQRYLDELARYARTFTAAAEMLSFAQQKTSAHEQQHKGDTSALGVERRNLFAEWQAIAVREGAMTLFHYADVMNSINGSLREWPHDRIGAIQASDLAQSGHLALHETLRRRVGVIATHGLDESADALLAVDIADHWLAARILDSRPQKGRTSRPPAHDLVALENIAIGMEMDRCPHRCDLGTKPHHRNAALSSSWSIASPKFALPCVALRACDGRSSPASPRTWRGTSTYEQPNRWHSSRIILLASSQVR